LDRGDRLKADQGRFKSEPAGRMAPPEAKDKGVLLRIEEDSLPGKGKSARPIEDDRSAARSVARVRMEEHEFRANLEISKQARINLERVQ
jgi:inhibitor of KinA sporulation pathway (predicted exonuclease)